MSSKVRYSLIGLALLLVLALTPFRPLKVSGASMEPTLKNGQTLLLDQLYWRMGGLKRNDIVVVRHDGENWVKRLVGVPGDQLQILRNGDWITEIDNLTVNPQLQQNDGEHELRRVGPSEIFVIGDNLNHSRDSTTQEAGAFRLNDVIGIARNLTLGRQFAFRDGG
jgi:signal peptidase I